MSEETLPVCPECGGEGLEYPTPSFSESHPLPVPCPACGGSGVDITEAVEAAARTIYKAGLPTRSFDKMGRTIPFDESMSPDEFRAAGRAVVLAVLAVLDKEGT